MLRVIDSSGNPSSIHAEGRAARAVIDKARADVAALVGADTGEVVFVSGATEAAATVIGHGWSRVFHARSEHPCVAASAAASAVRTGCRVVSLDIDASGRIDPAVVASAVERDAAAGCAVTGEKLVAVQFANNETGVVQPIAEIAREVKARGCWMMTDAVQAAGRLAIDFRACGADYLLVSSHKIGGPKGVGALVVRKGAPYLPLISGGGQEGGRRSGTEPVELIAGFGAAAVAARNEARRAEIAALRDDLEARLTAITPEWRFIGRGGERLVNTSLAWLPGARSETLVIAFDLAGIAVSSGAACASGKVKRSTVLQAMGYGEDVADAAIRFSLGWSTTADDIAACAQAWADIAGRTAPRRNVA